MPRSGTPIPGASTVLQVHTRAQLLLLLLAWRGVLQGTLALVMALVCVPPACPTPTNRYPVLTAYYYRLCPPRCFLFPIRSGAFTTSPTGDLVLLVPCLAAPAAQYACTPTAILGRSDYNVLGDFYSLLAMWSSGYLVHASQLAWGCRKPQPARPDAVDVVLAHLFPPPEFAALVAM